MKLCGVGAVVLRRLLCLLCAALIAVPPVYAGGPIVVGSPSFGASGQAFTWDVSGGEIQYRTDNGPLSSLVTEGSARARVIDNFQVWEDVLTSNIGFNRDTSSNSGFINDVGAFTDGDVSTTDEFNAVDGDCFDGNQNPIVYDADGTITNDIFNDPLVIGFAGPCVVLSNGRIGGGDAVLNGLFQDGIDNGTTNLEITAAEFDAAFIHEFGHFSGLDHSQINVNCLGACSADDEAGLPTMFPFLIFASQAVLSPDDVAWISRLYPQTSGGTTFANTHGTISGTVFFSDGASQAQGVNVIARRVDDPGTAGVDESRTIAVSAVSGFRFTSDLGNPILGGSGSTFGSRTPSHIGLFEIPVPAGDYTIEVESIDSGFSDGSSVGPLSPPIPMPGTAPAPSATISVAAGATDTGNNVTLIGTDPRFDAFEDSDFSHFIVPHDRLPMLREYLKRTAREAA